MAIGICGGVPGSARHAQSPIYSVGPFSDANFLSATGTGPSFAAGTTLLLSWYQVAAPTHDEYLWSMVDSTAGGHGWFFGVSSTGTKLMYIGAQGCANINPPLTFDANVVGRAHTILIDNDGTNRHHCTNAGAVFTQALGGTYIPPTGTTKHLIGHLDASVLAGVPASSMRLLHCAEFNQIFSNDVKQYLAGTTRRGDGRLDPAYKALARFYWDGSLFTPGAGTSVSLGSSPVTFTVNGTLSRQTENIGWTKAFDDSASSVGYFDNVTDVVQTDANGASYRRRTEFAYRKLVTDAPALSIEIVSRMFTYPTYDSIEVLVDGVHQGTVLAQANDVAHNVDIKLLGDGGSHTVTLIEGTQSNPSMSATVVDNTAIRSVSVPAVSSVTLLTPPTSVQKTLVIYGDSIAGGGNGSNPQRTAWSMLVRADFPTTGTGHVVFEAWGGRSLHEDWFNGGGSVAAEAARLAALCDGTVENTVVDFMETNDYGLNRQSAANFQARHLSLMQAFKALRPNAKWLAVGAIARIAPASETANAFGDTLTAYTTAKQTNITTMADVKYTFVDAHAWVSAGNYTLSAPYTTDGVHINDAGHVQIYTQVKATLGY
jgi:lysophospholipase L1-like esterase